MSVKQQTEALERKLKSLDIIRLGRLTNMVRQTFVRDCDVLEDAMPIARCLIDAWKGRIDDKERLKSLLCADQNLTDYVWKKVGDDCFDFDGAENITVLPSRESIERPQSTFTKVVGVLVVLATFAAILYKITRQNISIYPFK
jgi:hypothetical protein